METIVPTDVQLPHVSAANVAAIFGKPAEDAGAIFQRQQSMAEQFWRMLIGTPDHLGSVLSRLSKADKEAGRGKMVQTPEGNQVVPEVVALLVDSGYAYKTAEKMLSQMRKQRDAFLSPKHYIPARGTSWDNAYSEATKTLNSLAKSQRMEQVKQQRAAFVGAHISQALGTLPENAPADEQLEAIQAAKQQAEEEQRRRDYAKAARDFLRAAKAQPKDIPHLINALEDILAEWQQKQSAKTVEAAEVETSEQAQGVSTAALPERQRHVA